MTSQMNMVHNAARLAMADHRAAAPRRARARKRGFLGIAIFVAGLIAAALVSLVTHISEPG